MNRVFAGQAQLEELLRKFGADFSLAQGFGGNASIKNKDGTRMIVKSSGKRLSAVDDSDYFHEVTLRGRAHVDELPGQSSRASIETFFHALLESRFVIHLHSTFGVAISMIAQKETELDAELDARGIVRVGYFRPGLELSRAIGALRGSENSAFFLLSNHGILASADSALELEEKILAFEDWASRFLSLSRDKLIAPSDTGTKFTKAAAQKSHWHALNNWRVTPDHCVFLGPDPEREVLETLLSARRPEQVFEFRSTGPHPSPVGEQLGFFHNLSQMLPKYEFKTLSRSETRFLRGWEAERFRVAQVDSSSNGSVKR